MQRDIMFRFGQHHDSAYDEQMSKHYADTGQQPQQQPIKWSRTNVLNSDGGDCRRSFIPALKGLHGGSGYTQENRIGSPDEGIMSGPHEPNASKHSWRSLSKRVGIAHDRIAPEESDDTDNTNCSAQRCMPTHSTSLSSSKFKPSPRASEHSKASSSNSFNEDCLFNDSNATLTSPFNITRKSSTLLHEESSRITNDRVAATAEMNFIVLLGLVTGLLISKAMQYLQLYFCWFQQQVLQLRNAFLGQRSLVEFFNLDDTSRYAVRTKLLLIPIVTACCFLYYVVGFIHSVLRFVLTQVPNPLVAFVQRLYADF